MSDYQLLRRVSSGMLSRQESVEGGLFHAKYEPKEVLGQWVGREESMTVLWTLVDPLPSSLLPSPCLLLCSVLHALFSAPFSTPSSLLPPPCLLLCSLLHAFFSAPFSTPSSLLPPPCLLPCSPTSPPPSPFLLQRPLKHSEKMHLTRYRSGVCCQNHRQVSGWGHHRINHDREEGAWLPPTTQAHQWVDGVNTCLWSVFGKDWSDWSMCFKCV